MVNLSVNGPRYSMCIVMLTTQKPILTPVDSSPSINVSFVGEGNRCIFDFHRICVDTNGLCQHLYLLLMFPTTNIGRKKIHAPSFSVLFLGAGAVLPTTCMGVLCPYKSRILVFISRRAG